MRAAARGHATAICECLADDTAGDLGDNPTSASLRKLAIAIGEFAMQVANNTNGPKSRLFTERACL